MSEAVKRYCMRAAGSIVQPIEVPYSGTWVPSADHDRIVAELQKRLSTAPFFDQLRSLEVEHARVLALLQRIRDERDTLRAEVEQFRALAKANAESLGHALRDEKVLLAELEQLRKDAALFRRLRDLPDELLGAPGVPCVAIPEGPRAGRYVSGPDLDAALEASR